MGEGALHQQMMNLVTGMGDFGVFVAMFLESSVIPLPSEVIVIGAGAIGIPLASIVIFGALGSTFGGMAGYLLGRYAAVPVVLKFGKFILIKPHHIYQAEAFAKKYGTVGVFIGRLIPVVPFKVFSIAAGITKIPVVPFLLCTLAGVLPRMYLLALFGSIIIQYKKPALLVLAAVVLIFAALKISRAMYRANGQKAPRDDA
jgi:membrane protein DedA with SNARE-associated domain